MIPTYLVNRFCEALSDKKLHFQKDPLVKVETTSMLTFHIYKMLTKVTGFPKIIVQESIGANTIIRKD